MAINMVVKDSVHGYQHGCKRLSSWLSTWLNVVKDSGHGYRHGCKKLSPWLSTWLKKTQSMAIDMVVKDF